MIEIKKKIGIFTKYEFQAKYFFDKLIGNMKFEEIDHATKNSNEWKAILKDGTEYKIYRGYDSVRGLRIDKAYVSKNLPIEFFEHILPTLFRGDTDIEYLD
jgi:hypothetical protein